LARTQIGFDKHPSSSLVKNPQNGGPGEVSGPGAWAQQAIPKDAVFSRVAAYDLLPPTLLAPAGHEQVCPAQPHKP
jgi:hypothetical protein